ncbi:MAG: ATP-dependent Clp protease adaptor ClpS [Pirellulaceae bacterium]
MSSQQAAAEPDVAVAEPEAPAGEPAVKTRRKARPDPKKKPPRRQPRYHVILWNDNDHSYDYVVEMMQKLFAHEVEKGYLIAKEVDKQGKAIVLTTTMEHAELKRDQIHAYGPDKMIARCQGSMSATIEAEPG